MESSNEDVELGKLIDENSYSNDEKHINIDNVINIDFIRLDNVLHEIKKSNKIENASIWQVKYYLYYLKKTRCIYKSNYRLSSIKEKNRCCAGAGG